MKYITSQLSHFLSDKSTRRNIRMLLNYIAFIFGVIIAYAVLFHIIMLQVEGEEHSWVTGFYWTLTVMSTLGFGDITFESDIGRIFSIIVLLSGIILLLIVLPFAFIRFFYAPLLETQIRMRAPRKVPPDTKGHVIICAYDSIAPGFITRLEQEGIPYFILEPDPAIAANWHLDGISVISSEIDTEATYQALNLSQSRMVLVNREDTVNTKIILTLTHLGPRIPIVAIASENNSVDVLELSGATHVLPLKRWLGEQLSSRVSALHAKSYPIGRYKDLLIAELPVHYTALAGKTIRETSFRQISGASIIGIWERGRLLPVRPATLLHNSSVLVIIGTETQLNTLDNLYRAKEINPNPVVVIGGGRVGAAVTETLQKRGISVNLVERNPELCKRFKHRGCQVFVGDGADYDLLKRAGILKTHTVVLTTNDDAMNVYLASYCRQLNKELRIVSRITQERNIEVIHRAGADFVLSYASLGAEAVFSILKGKELIVLGEGINLFSIATPRSLYGKQLSETEIGAQTGLTVIAIQQNGHVTTHLTGSTVFESDTELLMLGDTQQRSDFINLFGGG